MPKPISKAWACLYVCLMFDKRFVYINCTDLEDKLSFLISLLNNIIMNKNKVSLFW